MKTLQTLAVLDKVLVGAHALVLESSVAGTALLATCLSFAQENSRPRQDIQVFSVNKCADIVDKAIGTC